MNQDLKRKDVKINHNEIKRDDVKINLPKETPLSSKFQDLIFLGRNIKKIEIDGWIFELKTLSAKENRELMHSIMELAPEKRMIYSKPYLLSNAINSINGLALDIASKSAGFEDKLDFILNFQDSLIEFLFEEFNTLSVDSKSIFSKEEDLKEELKK